MSDLLRGRIQSRSQTKIFRADHVTRIHCYHTQNNKTEEYLCDSEKSKLILSATLVAAWVQDLVRAPRLVDRGGGLCRRDG